MFLPERQNEIENSRRAGEVTVEAEEDIKCKIEKIEEAMCRPFKCSECGDRFNDFNALVTHTSVHTGEAYNCDKCDFTCTQLADLTVHRTVHTGEKPFATCETAEPSTLEKNSCVRRDSDRPHFCYVCLENFAELTDLITHMSVHTGYKPKDPVIQDVPPVCENNNVGGTNLSPKKSRHKCCDICGVKCGSRLILSKHMLKHERKDKFTCSLCNFSCARKHNLTKHVRSHGPKKVFSCDICDYTCYTNAGFSQHKRKHIGEKRFSCHLCKYKCKWKKTLTKHVERHAATKSCRRKKAKVCETEPTVHAQKHPYACGVCGFTCLLQDSLTAHMREHTGGRLTFVKIVAQ